MAILILRRLWLAGLLMNFTLVHAQPVSHQAPTAPAKAPSTTFFSSYLSIFTDYQPYKEQPLLPWREVNDNVGKIGGWRFYAREAQQPETDKPARSDPTVDDHAGHGGRE